MIYTEINKVIEFIIFPYCWFHGKISALLVGSSANRAGPVVT